MKIKVIERSLDDVLPARLGAPAPQHRNLDPALHPFAKSREYTRALTAAKMDRMFAKPFVDALEGHNDGVYCMSRDPDRLGTVASGAGDGDVRLWSLPTRETLVAIPRAHRSMVKDIAFAPTQHSSSADGMASTSRRRLEDAMIDAPSSLEDADDADSQETGATSRFLTCSADKTIKLWDAQALRSDAMSAGQAKVSSKPLRTYTGRIGFNSISHHRSETVFASASDRIDVWDQTRSEPILSMNYGSLTTVKGKARDDAIGAGDHVISVKFNQSETSVIASTGSDRSVCLYDVRSGKATSRLSMEVRANQISWNPLQPPVFLLASENSDLYTFDMRKMTSATQVFKGHVGSVMSCDWSPTGREFVSGAYDRTVRVWKAGQGKSEDTYHTQRMQRVFSTIFTLDSRFVLSGSDDGNLRIWKAHASAKLGTMSTKELGKTEYRDSLREKWKDVGEISRVERQRFVPKAVHNATKLRKEMDSAEKRKEGNRRRHAPRNRPAEKPKAERKRGIVKID